MSIGEPVRYDCPNGTACCCTGECRIPPEKRRKRHPDPIIRKPASFEDFCTTYDVKPHERNMLVDYLKMIRNQRLDKLKTTPASARSEDR